MVDKPSVLRVRKIELMAHAARGAGHLCPLRCLSQGPEHHRQLCRLPHLPGEHRPHPERRGEGRASDLAPAATGALRRGAGAGRRRPRTDEGATDPAGRRGKLTFDNPFLPPFPGEGGTGGMGTGRVSTVNCGVPRKVALHPTVETWDSSSAANLAPTPSPPAAGLRTGSPEIGGRQWK